MRVLIIGGYGNFGFRLAKLLKNETHLTLYLVGRDLAKAEIACRELRASSAEFRALKLDRTQDLTPQLGDLVFDFVVDASGPFQAYGAHPFTQIR